MEQAMAVTRAVSLAEHSAVWKDQKLDDRMAACWAVKKAVRSADPLAVKMVVPRAGSRVGPTAPMWVVSTVDAKAA